MFVSTIVPAILALAGSSLALPAASVPMSVFETLEAPQPGWVESKGAFVKRDAKIQLRVQLTHQNMDAFAKKAMNIATPGHELYGKFMSTEEIDDMIAPSEESRNLVTEWLQGEGLTTKLNWRGNVILVNTTVAKVEELLSANYKTYVDADTGRQTVGTLGFSVPSHLMEHIKTVQPTTLLGFKNYAPARKPVPKRTNSTTDATPGCSGVVNPACLASLYNFKDITIPTGGKMGITGFIGQFPSKTDLKDFLTKSAISGNSAASYTCVAIAGGSCAANPASPGDEADLDVQFARGLIGNIPMEFYSTGGESNSIFDTFGEYLLKQTAADLPNTVSISYGGSESGITASIASATCDVFMQLGARGVSTMIATGDSGVGTGCTAATGYQPDFPSSCPYVTAVGGLSGTVSAAAETGWTDGGGGFSNKFTQPTYQSTQVAKWLSTNKDGKTTYYNAKGRAYPDVAAAAVDFEIVVGGKAEAVDGTSCASPTFASVIQLINSQRVAAGKAALGFLNPFLYSTGAAGLTDILAGGNTGCANLKGGFSAIAGWDPATGLGAPNYAKLLAAASAA